MAMEYLLPEVHDAAEVSTRNSKLIYNTQVFL